MVDLARLERTKCTAVGSSFLSGLLWLSRYCKRTNISKIHCQADRGQVHVIYTGTSRQPDASCHHERACQIQDCRHEWCQLEVVCYGVVTHEQPQTIHSQGHRSQRLLFFSTHLRTSSHVIDWRNSSKTSCGGQKLTVSFGRRKLQKGQTGEEQRKENPLKTPDGK